MKISAFRLDSSSLKVVLQNGQSSDFSYFWLRDNARDPVSFDSQSHQRELFTAKVPANISPEQVELKEDGQFICIKWPDLENFADYDSGFLAAYFKPMDEIDVPVPMLWDAHNITSDLVSIEYDQALTRSGTSDALKKIADYGFVLVKHCPCEQTSGQVCK